MNRQFCFLLLSLTVMFLRLFTLCISAVCSFVLLRSSSLHGRIPQTIILSVGGPLRCFQLEATMNKAVCDYSCTRFCAEFPVLLKKVPQSAVPGSHGKCPYTPTRSCPVLFQCAVSSCMGFSSGSGAKNRLPVQETWFSPWVRKVSPRKWQPTPYSCLGNSVDWGAWRATVHGVARVGHNLATKQQKQQVSYIDMVLTLWRIQRCLIDSLVRIFLMTHNMHFFSCPCWPIFYLCEMSTFFSQFLVLIFLNYCVIRAFFIYSRYRSFLLQILSPCLWLVFSVS